MIFNCIFCNKESKTLYGLLCHLIFCSKGPEKFYSTSLIFLQENYITKEKGFTVISKETGIPYRALKKSAIFYGIPIRSLSENAYLCMNRMEVKEKLRKASKNQKRYPVTDEVKKRLRLLNTGKKHSEETKKKLRLLNKGKKFSEDHKENIRNGIINMSPQKKIHMIEGIRNNHRKSQKYKTGYYSSIKSSQNYYYKSSWELFAMQYLDAHTGVASWEYEPFFIKYFDENGKQHLYFPDFYVKFDCGIKEIWEIKPRYKVKDCKNKLESLNSYVKRNGYNSYLIMEEQIEVMKKYYEENLKNGPIEKVA